MHLSVWVESGWWRTGKEATGQYTCQCGWSLAGGGLGRRLPVSALVSVGGVWLVEDWEGGYRSVHLSVWVGSGWWRTGKEATGQRTCQCGWGLAGGGLGRRLPVGTLVSVGGVWEQESLSQTHCPCSKIQSVEVTSCVWLIIKWL